MSKRKAKFSGIGGQAVLEGIMMRNGKRYAVAVRKPNAAIEVMASDLEIPDSIWRKIPFIRGVFAFVDSLKLGMSTLEYSAQFYEEEEEKETKFDKFMTKIFGDKAEKVVSFFVIVFSLIIAVGLFIALPYVASVLLSKVIANESLLIILEGVIRLVIFLGYVSIISLNRDIKRVYMYHGAEHKCINCIENGNPLTVENVMKASRKHKRCGTSFLMIIMLITIILFFFIRVDSAVLRLALRVALVPVVAGISYEILQYAGKHDNILVDIMSAPGLWLQSITVKEPTSLMAEVAIESVEAVFDWKTYLKENFDEHTEDIINMFESEDEAEDDDANLNDMSDDL